MEAGIVSSGAGIRGTHGALGITGSGTSAAAAIARLANSGAVHVESIVADALGAHQMGVDLALGAGVRVFVQTIVALSEAGSRAELVRFTQRES